MTIVPPDAGDPEVSVVMVSHGSWRLTERAVDALVAHTDRPFELIVVDNGSDGETVRRVSRLHHARVILNEENRGFGPASNQGAEHARGEYLLLLNTDAFVHPGWLEPLLETIQQPGVGAVVPRFLHPDGSLQDAGVLVACDGTVQVHGDGDRAERLRYRFKRRVDYGSAACLLIRREAFTTVGGFDDAYAPAYYEDVDLAMRLSRIGLATVYQPRSTVTHVRYGSGGQDQAAELSERNRRTFAERWRAELFGRPWTFTGVSDQAAIAARDVNATPRVLICANVLETTVVPLIRSLLTSWPNARITWATRTKTTDSFDPEMWLAAGVELADAADPIWLESRLFHYDVVFLSRPDRRLLDVIERTQPQASHIALAELDPEPDALLAQLSDMLAAAGIGPAHSIHKRKLRG